MQLRTTKELINNLLRTRREIEQDTIIEYMYTMILNDFTVIHESFVDVKKLNILNKNRIFSSADIYLVKFITKFLLVIPKTRAGRSRREFKILMKNDLRVF